MELVAGQIGVCTVSPDDDALAVAANCGCCVTVDGMVVIMTRSGLVLTDS